MQQEKPLVTVNPLKEGELRFCSYIEQVWRLRSLIPTAEIGTRALGISTGEYNGYWNNNRVRAYLSGIGIDVEAITNPDTDQRSVLTPLQLLAVNKILDFNEKKPDHKKLQEIGVKTRTWQAWRSDPVFAAYLKERVEKIIGSGAEVDRALFERAISGDVSAIKFIKELSGEYRPASAASNSSVDVQLVVIRVQEILMRHLASDPDLLQRIGAEIEALADSSGLRLNGPVGRTVMGELETETTQYAPGILP